MTIYGLLVVAVVIGPLGMRERRVAEELIAMKSPSDCAQSFVNIFDAAGQKIAFVSALGNIFTNAFDPAERQLPRIYPP